MYYAPHKLQRLVVSGKILDELGRPAQCSVDKTWVDVCRCRCDHDGETEIKMPDGTIVKSQYHIVLEGRTLDVEIGDTVRCLNDDGTVRGKGDVINKKTLNYLPYAEIYV